MKKEKELLLDRIDRYFSPNQLNNCWQMHRMLTRFYPIGLAYNGKLVFDYKDIKKEDADRLPNNRIAFEKEMGKTLPEGSEEKENWDAWMRRCVEDPGGAHERRLAVAKKLEIELLEQAVGHVSFDVMVCCAESYSDVNCLQSLEPLY